MILTASLLDVKFVLALGLIGLVRLFWPTRFYMLFGALSSALILGLAAPPTFLVISALTLFYIYPLHRITRARETGSRPKRAGGMIFSFGIAGLVALLLVFKLYRYFSIPWLGGPRLQGEVVALIGFSYFTFRAISFLHIQSILPLDERRPWGLLYFMLFPPTITSGPIQKFQDFRQQLNAPQPLSMALLGTVAYRVTRGYFRKLVLATFLNEYSIKLLAIPQPTIVVSALTIAALYLFFYFDFAGYSDIAIGFGLLLGIRVPENFKKPFLATTVSEFWRNYHITLVDWFRDQVFIPLGGMRASRWRAAALAFLVMLLCGLWHGLTLSFLAWGTWHGTILAVEALSGSKPVPPALRRGPAYWGRVFWTNARVAFGAVFFLPAAGDTLKLLRGFTHWSI